MTPTALQSELSRALPTVQKTVQSLPKSLVELNATFPRLESELIAAARARLRKEGYTEIFVPRMVRATGACENVDTLFEISVDKNYDWFGQNCRAYLAQTGQLYLESWVPKLNKTYCVGPSFRAEYDVDARHLTEFTMLEIEFAGDFQMLLSEIEGIFSAMIHRVLRDQNIEKNFGLTATDRSRLKRALPPFPKTTYTEAITILQNKGIDIQWGDDIKTKQEAMLVDHFGKKPLFITHYPNPLVDHGKEIEVEKFFNMIPDPHQPHLVQSADLILPIAGEAVGSAARIYDPQTMVERLTASKMFKRLQAKGGGLEDFAWYIHQLQTHGSIPHAGCGIGISRVIKWLRGAEDIREAITFPSNREILI